ncbi:hypothetical protein, variant 11 [Aphanomyces invadans]|uniref:ACB domain-containing protein n=1 Tax=Aphanomyces invadans TaxID=157072 RepID=A0A024TYK1_9STRA|nr:hypothetical protein, variant 10 [Aphanomyces invadans]XP_008872916.1 hypothetical protein, variant 11 [Aphanomyces invadans]ETV98715.1 hypothetical protein, variant 10 [Aphanomyces invadans]ETV98716.1 hypothetical protein, variant 11 [Aphanomyces invadans]|eukprot:XP_008872915.1 hypothetical protein, variant 10 [Aphanomyces invadans]
MAGEAAFHAAAARVLTAQATHKHLLARHAMQLYGLHEQALHGDISTERPRCPINYDGKAKWDAWNARRGMSNAAAQAEYVQLVHAILPEDAPNSESASSGTSRQSMARRIKRYKPQKAGQTSFPRLVGTFFGTLALLLVATTVAISLSRTISDVCRPLAHASGACDIWLASHSIRVTVGWVSIGLAFGTLLQSNVRPACPLEQNHFTCSPQLLQWNILSVLYYVDAPRGTAQERSEASEGAADLDLLHSLGLVLGKVGAATEEHPVMVFKPVPGSAALGSTRSVLEHPIEIVRRPLSLPCASTTTNRSFDVDGRHAFPPLQRAFSRLVERVADAVLVSRWGRRSCREIMQPHSPSVLHAAACYRVVPAVFVTICVVRRPGAACDRRD